MPRVYISVGSNIEREFHVRSALQALRTRFGHLILSQVYESAAVGFEGDDFFNLVVGFDTEEGVLAVASFLREIESAHCRDRRAPRFSSRTLDLDLLLYGELVGEVAGMRLPREEIQRYAFVLGPLAEIAGDVHNPLDGRSFAEMWRAFDSSGQPMHPVEFALE